MYFFIFNEPKLIENLSVNSLSDFISLLDNEGKLYSRFLEKFSKKDEEVETGDEEKGYQKYIAYAEANKKREYAAYLSSHNSKQQGDSKHIVFYRGISDSSYVPVPSVYRNNTIKYEDKYINDIRVSNPGFVQGRDYIDELSALQHYWCPTRLLDLTINPLVALYFACEDLQTDNSSKEGCIEFYLAKSDEILHSNSDKVLILTALSHLPENDKKAILEICVDEIESKGVNKAILNGTLASRVSVKKLYREILRTTNFDRSIMCIDLLQSFYVQPALNNSRIRAQSGLFLINGLCQNERECSLRNNNKMFARIIVPSSAKKNILRELDRVGINRKTMFPEIEDTVKYLKTKYK